MVNPVPGYGVSTPYKKRGKYWSLDRRNGLGIHTGDDYAAPAGTRIVAGASGTVVSIDYTSSYGWRTTIESVIDGVKGRDYYCHQPKAGPVVKVGQKVTAGQRIGRVGSTGNVTGPHCHLERRVAPYAFALSCFRDPAVIRRYAAPVVVAPIARPTSRPADVVSHTLWNLAGFDTVGEGAKTFASRTDGIAAEVKAIGSDVYSLLEVPKQHADKLERALTKVGYKVAVYFEGRMIAVRKAMKVGRTAAYVLPTKGPADDARQAVYAEVYVGAYAWLFTAAHYEHRNGSQYDPVRVAQGKEDFAKGERLRAAWDIDPTRVSYAADENSNTWVVDEAFEPHDYFDAFEGAWQSINEPVGTNPGWGKTTPHGPRIDKIKRHRRRPVRRAHVRKASAGKSDHLPTTVIYGTTKK